MSKEHIEKLIEGLSFQELTELAALARAKAPEAEADFRERCRKVKEFAMSLGLTVSIEGEVIRKTNVGKQINVPVRFRLGEKEWKGMGPMPQWLETLGDAGRAELWVGPGEMPQKYTRVGWETRVRQTK